MNPIAEAKVRRIGEAARMTAAGKTDVLRAVLHRRFPIDRYVVLEEVADSTGGPGRQYADALVLECWASDGLRLHGFELKVSRGDWKREIAKPDKHTLIAGFCDTWTLLTYGTGVARQDEIPEGWGWQVVGEDEELETVVKAPRRQAKPLSRDFLAAMFRRAAEAGPCATFTGLAVADVAQRLGLEAERERRECGVAKRELNAALRALGELVNPAAPPWTFVDVGRKHLAGRAAGGTA